MQDIFLGVIKILPTFIDQKVQDEWYPLIGGAGHMRVQMCFKLPAQQLPLTIDAFDLLKVIGKGSFGKVFFLVHFNVGALCGGVGNASP